ncbi:MAG: carboxypeptidase regulatory-like domain-containing protein [Terriglobales bacterium]
MTGRRVAGLSLDAKTGAKINAFWRAAAAAGTLALLLMLAPGGAWGQSQTTGGISGVVRDPSGAVIPAAKVTATDVATGAVRHVTTNAQGEYTIAQVNPGSYRLRAVKPGFKTEIQGPVPVAVSQVAEVNFSLAVGSQAQTVEVTGAAPLLQPQNPNTATAVSQTQIANLPNSGGDLTYEAQIAPGAVMNSTGGYGNVEYNGLPSVSNNWTLNGLDNNNPNLNLNGSGATNLQLGLNNIQQVTVNTNSFGVDHGRQAGAQVNYISKSGTNRFHGNLFETWNGRAMNANDYFLNASGQGRPFSNVNQFGGSIGGPIKRNKLFFFYDYEALRIALPVLHSVTVPTSAYQAYSLAQLPLGGYDPTVTGNSFCPPSLQGANGPACAQAMPKNPGEAPFMQAAYKLYGNTNIGTPLAMEGCPLNANGTMQPAYNPLASPGASNPVPDGDGCGNQGTVAAAAHTQDTYQVFRMDYDRSASDMFWGDFSNERGLQATYTDPINPIFDATSNQPERTSAAGWTHVFSPNVINQFNPGLTWGDAIFGLNSYQTAEQNLGLELEGPFYPLNASGGFPGGYNTTVWELNDNLSWLRGAHNFKFGVDFRRVDISQIGIGTFGVVPYSTEDLPEFTNGVTGFSYVGFVASTNEPEAYTNLDLYAMDTWQLTPRLTFTIGIRASDNTNPVNQHDLFSSPTADWNTMTHNVNSPPGNLFQLGQHSMFVSVPFIQWQPRAALAYQLGSRTLFKAGWGMFEDVYPGAVGSTYDGNPPYSALYTSGLFGQVGGEAIAPNVPGSAIGAAQTANATFQKLFTTGGLSCASSNANPNACISPVGATAFPYSENIPPMVYEWKLSVDRQLTRTLALTVAYTGDHTVHIPYTYSPNGYQTACAGCFAPWNYNAPPDPRFSTWTQYAYNGYANYNGLQISAIQHMGHGLMLDGNYTWSHCLDTISNGGIFGFFGFNNLTSPLPGDLNGLYGNCDYDVRSAFNASYVYRLPVHASGWMGRAVNGWQVAGTVFLRSGLPFNLNSSLPSGTLNNTSGPSFPNLVSGEPLYETTSISGITQSNQIQWLNPSAFASVMDTATGDCYDAATRTEALDAAACQFGDLGRNVLRGPGFAWTDMSLSKFFQVTEHVRFQAEVTAYNLFNHPNFQQPGGTTAGVPGVGGTLTGFGTISSTVGSPTSILGFGLGGDDSVRMIALEGKLVF